MKRAWLWFGLGVLTMLSGPITYVIVIGWVQRLLVVTRLDPNPLCDLDCAVLTLGTVEVLGLVLVISSSILWFKVAKNPQEMKGV